MTRLKLNESPAIANINEAEAVLHQIYDLEKQIRKYEKRRDEMIETAQKNCQNLTAGLVRDRDILARGLEAFSNEHFAGGESKSHSCEWGKFGLRKQTCLVIDDITACIKALRKKGLDECIKIVESVNRRVLGQKDDKVIESVGACRESEDVFFWETQKG